MQGEEEEEEEEEEAIKWQGKGIAEVKGVRAEQVWACLEDFGNIHSYFPGLATCQHVGGPLGQPGMIRYCASPPQPTVMWARERLLLIDPLARSLTYEVLHNNMGFRTYVATAKVTTSFCDAPTPTPTSNIHWSFVCDPVHGFTRQALEHYLQSCVTFMATKISSSLK